MVGRSTHHVPRRHELHRSVVADGARLAQVQDDLDRRRPASTGTYAQAVDVDVAQIGVVDLGWAGSIQKSLSVGLAQIGFAGTLRGFYLATNEGAEQHLTATNRNEGFVADLGSPPASSPSSATSRSSSRASRAHRLRAPLRGTAGCCAHTTTSRRRSGSPSSGCRTACDRASRVGRTRAAGRHARRDDSDVWRVVIRQILQRFCADPTHEEIELFRTWRHDDNRAPLRRADDPRVFEERGPAAAMLAGALEMDELLWAAAVESLNGGAVGVGARAGPRGAEGRRSRPHGAGDQGCWPTSWRRGRRVRRR